MTANQIIQELKENNTISRETILEIEKHALVGQELVRYFKENKNREWALQLLRRAVEIRNEPYPKGYDIGTGTLMLAGYIVGLHQQIEDCLEIWKAKTVDFDTFCGFDIQLVVFGGVANTIAYLKQQNAEDAVKYITECDESGDFDTLDQYFNPDGMPYYI
ncbi:hypothetical protein [Flavobacterium cerinum]|uniref:Uncharacterized protein n=1 Tax=Flavobacterium cerinum TaxID=2502784 RepID=A0ABY5IMU6_9FLAO|nr:hypothetical protein [Flavobacterium cerinum]UUC44079.1 hypothetical protein NOX80_10590 [Flavobacterium cerinum]